SRLLQLLEHRQRRRRLFPGESSNAQLIAAGGRQLVRSLATAGPVAFQIARVLALGARPGTVLVVEPGQLLLRALGCAASGEAPEYFVVQLLGASQLRLPRTRLGRLKPILRRGLPRTRHLLEQLGGLAVLRVATEIRLSQHAQQLGLRRRA